MSSLISQHQAAAFLGISHKTLVNWRFQSRGPAYVKLGKGKTAKIAYLQEDLEKFVQDNRIEPVLVTPGRSKNGKGVDHV